MPKRPLEGWWESLFPGTPSQVPRRSYRGGSATPSTGRGYVRPSDTPIAQARRSAPAPSGRWVSFGVAPRTRAYNPSYVPITNDPDSADMRAFSTPDSTPAPTESAASYGRMQALEIDSPLAVPEATRLAFAPWLVEAAAGMLITWTLTRILPRAKNTWFDKLKDIIRHFFGKDDPKPVSHTVISGTPQPKAMCHPGFPNSFTVGLGTPIATS